MNRKITFGSALFVIFAMGYVYGNRLGGRIPDGHTFITGLRWILIVFVCLSALVFFLVKWMFVQEHLQRDAEKKRVEERRDREEEVGKDGSQKASITHVSKPKTATTEVDKPKEKKSPKPVLAWVFKGIVLGLSIFLLVLAALKLIAGNIILGAALCLITLGLLLLVFKRTKRADQPAKKRKSVLVWVLKVVFLLWLILGISEWIAGGALHFAYTVGMLNHTVFVTKWGLPPYPPPTKVQKPTVRHRMPGD